MPKQPPQIFTRLGELIVKWNELEGKLQSLVHYLGNDWVTAVVLTAHMGNVSLVDALRTLATERDETAKMLDKYGASWRREKHWPPLPLLLPDVTHLITCFERLREYRNFYVHGITRTGEGRIFIASSTSARARLTVHEMPVRVRDLIQLIKRIEAVDRYASGVLTFAARMRSRNPWDVPPTSPERPPIPDRLKKPPLLVLGAERLPRSLRR